MTTLQREANRIYGMTAKQTLDTAQSLYEKKLITYPRTDSQYLTEDMEQTARNVVRQIYEKYQLTGPFDQPEFLILSFPYLHRIPYFQQFPLPQGAYLRCMVLAVM